MCLYDFYSIGIKYVWDKNIVCNFFSSALLVRTFMLNKFNQCHFSEFIWILAYFKKGLQVFIRLRMLLRNG